VYGDAGEFDQCFGINLEIWNQWLYHGTDDKACSDSVVHSYGDCLIARIKLNVSNVMYRNYLDYHTSAW